MNLQQRKDFALTLALLSVAVAYRLSVPELERFIKLCRDKGIL